MSRAATVRCRALPRARAAAPWRPVHRVSARRAHNHTPSNHPTLSLQAEGRARTHTRTTDPLWHSVALQPRRSFQPQHIPPALPAGTPTVPARCGWAHMVPGVRGHEPVNFFEGPAAATSGELQRAVRTQLSTRVRWRVASHARSAQQHCWWWVPTSAAPKLANRGLACPSALGQVLVNLRTS